MILGGGTRHRIIAIAVASLLLGSGLSALANPFLRGADRTGFVLNIAHAGA